MENITINGQKINHSDVAICQICCKLNEPALFAFDLNTSEPLLYKAKDNREASRIERFILQNHIPKIVDI